MSNSADKLKWLSDETIPDWTAATPNQNLGNKVWKVRNIGTTTWDANYVLAHDSGDQMGAPDSVPLPQLAPNEEGQVVVPSITAPSMEGIYKSNWIPRNATRKAFLSNLTIVVDVSTTGGSLPSSTVSNIAQELSGYGITLIPDNWENQNAQRVRDMIVQVAQRLYNFALPDQSAAVLNSPQDVFQRFFPRRVLRRNPDATRPFSCTDNQGEPATCQAYAWNDGTNITFYSNAFFNGTRKVINQSSIARFAVTFTTEFLVLHELSHGHPWQNDYIETSQPLVDMVAAIVPGHTHYNVENVTIASAGFKQAARSRNDRSEYSTDAIANWCQQSFTGPADGDTDGFGAFRRNQMDAMVRKWLAATYGPIPH